LQNTYYPIQPTQYDARAFHTTHGHSPGELVFFGRDMFMSISKNIDWNAIKDKKHKAIAKSNLRENSEMK
jgi:hypothetical protein